MIYLVTKYGKDDSLYPKDPVKQARVNSALHFESGVLFARMRFIFVSDVTCFPLKRLIPVPVPA